jgi:hypothetical protein
VAKSVVLEEGELTTLITESRVGHTVQAAFGSGGVRLLDVPENSWAMFRIAEMRGIEILEEIT